MKAKTIISVVLLILLFIILLNNNEQTSFWLFKEIHTSKLVVLSIFFVSGMVTGGILFRRRDKHPKEYRIGAPSPERVGPVEENLSDRPDSLSDEDKEYLRRD